MVKRHYANRVKQIAYESFLEAWDQNNRGDMELDEIHIKTARTRFERWWDRTHA